MTARQRPIDELKSEPGEPLPPGGNGKKVWLFTCCDCGRRWSDPPGPVADCSCGGNVVAHRFDPGDYRDLRRYGRIEP